MEEIPSYLKKEYIGSGLNGRCYLTEDNRVFKQFKNTNSDNEYIIDLYDFAKENKSDIFMFPNEIVYLKYLDNI